MKPILVLRHVPHEGLGTLDESFGRAGLECRTLDVFDETAGLAFKTQDYAGLVVLGGPMNVDQTDQFPFLATEVEWLKLAIAENLPVLGICLGSQLLAKALGARVYPNRIKEIGWYEVQLTEAAGDDLLLAGCQASETVFQWHGDTFDLPHGAVQLARSSQCEQQAFRFGSSAYALQFHLEVTAETIDDWLTEPGNCGELAGLDYIDPAAIRRQTPTALAEMQRTADRVLGRFARLCAERK